MKNSSKKHFIFDVDDTLTNSYEHNQQMFVDTFLPHVSKMDDKVESYIRDLHYKSRGVSMHLQFAEAVNHLKLNIDPKQLVSENEQIHIENIHKITSFESVHDIMKWFKNNHKDVSVCTNRQYGSLMKILENNKLTHYFKNIISCIDEGYEKPDPFCLNKLIKESGLKKSDFIYFGDSKTDYEFASNAGIDFVIIDQYMNKKQFFKMLLQVFF